MEEPKNKEKYEDFLDDIRELENNYNGNTAYSGLKNSKNDLFSAGYVI